MPAVKATGRLGPEHSRWQGRLAGVVAATASLLAVSAGLLSLYWSSRPVLLPIVTVIGPNCRDDVYIRDYDPGDGGASGETWIYSLRAREPGSRRLVASQPVAQRPGRGASSTTVFPQARMLWAGAGFTVLMR